MNRTKKIQAIIGLVMVIAMLAVPRLSFAQEIVQVGAECSITASALNVRTGPGNNYAKARDALARGTKLVVTGISGSWILHNTGWSHVDYTTCGQALGATVANPSSVSGNSQDGSWCYATSPQFDAVAVGNPGPQQRVHEYNSTQRRWELTWHWQNGGAWNWIKASGGTWTGTLCQESRQPDERIHELQGLGNTLIIEGLELRGSIHAEWPACLSTDQPIKIDEDGGYVQPDKKNPAKVCTNCAVENTTVSFWSDCGDWKELWPENRVRD